MRQWRVVSCCTCFPAAARTCQELVNRFVKPHKNVACQVLAAHERNVILAATTSEPTSIAAEYFTLETLDKGVSPTDAHFGDFLETVRQHRIDQRVYHVPPFESGPDDIVILIRPGSWPAAE